jgi:hypothetical protein
MIIKSKRLGASLTLLAIAGMAASAAVAMPEFGGWSAVASIETLPGSSADVNSASIDGCASISPDGLSLAFNSFRSGNQQIYLATRNNISEGFGDPIMLPAPINTAAQEFCPTLARGKKLYFTRSGNGPGDIYVSRLGPNGWSDPASLGPAVNSVAMVEEAPTFYEDDDGREVMLFSRRPGGPLVGPDGKIFQSIDGAPATLVAGGPHSTASDNRPSVTHDGKSIFWDSSRAGALGGPDYWYATRSSTSQPWGQAVHLSQLSSAQADTRPFVSWNGEVMIISSANDIWFATRETAPGN